MKDPGIRSFSEHAVTNRFETAAIVVLLVSFNVIIALKYVDFSAMPYEDAAILMRYADHFAKGHGIVWNIGEKPVDGATDFMYMIVVGLLVKAGLALELSTRLVGFVSHVLTVVVIYLTLRCQVLTNKWMALFSALYVSVGPGLFYVAAYFGTPFFALFACLSWSLALLLLEDVHSNKNSLLFAICSLFMGLTRPEGVILAFLMLIAIVYYRGLKHSLTVVSYFMLVVGGIGGLYFLWRWNYFGYPLPNPFYKKGGSLLHFDSLKASIINVTKLSLPFLPAFVLGFRSLATLRLTIVVLLPVLGFSAAFVLISNDTNYLARFQYAVLPVVAMSCPALLRSLARDFGLPDYAELHWEKRFTLVAVVVLLAAMGIGYSCRWSSLATNYRDGRYDIAVMLSKYQDRGYTMATTESGLLPLYSRWRTLDAWGLNDQWVAHHGRITAEYIDRYKPQIIVFHADFSPIVPIQGQGAWFDTIMELKRYAEQNGYVLAAVFGENPYDTHYYYVSTDFAESAEVVEHIRSADYNAFATGTKAINYALLRR